MDPVKEAEVNILTVNKLVEIADKLSSNKELEQAINAQNSPLSQQIVNQMLFNN